MSHYCGSIFTATPCWDLLIICTSECGSRFVAGKTPPYGDKPRYFIHLPRAVKCFYRNESGPEVYRNLPKRLAGGTDELVGRMRLRVDGYPLGVGIVVVDGVVGKIRCGSIAETMARPSPLIRNRFDACSKARRLGLAAVNRSR